MVYSIYMDGKRMVKVVRMLVASPVLRATLGRRLRVVGFTVDRKEEQHG